MKQKYEKVSDQELLETIEIISKKLAYKFKFGYHELEDMRQQISIFAIEGLEKYDYERPLENFLWTHVRNRLFNFKRDNYQRPNKPCHGCPFYDSMCGNTDNDCLEFSNKLDCKSYKQWYDRNNIKKNLMYLNSIEGAQEYFLKSVNNADRIENEEFIGLLDKALYGVHREIYLKLKMGSKIGKKDMNKLIRKIKEFVDQ